MYKSQNYCYDNFVFFHVFLINLMMVMSTLTEVAWMIVICYITTTAAACTWPISNNLFEALIMLLIMNVILYANFVTLFSVAIIGGTEDDRVGLMNKRPVHSCKRQSEASCMHARNRSPIF